MPSSAANAHRGTQHIRTQFPVPIPQLVEIQVKTNHSAETSGRSINYSCAIAGGKASCQFPIGRKSFTVVPQQLPVRSDKRQRIVYFAAVFQLDGTGDCALVAHREIPVGIEHRPRFLCAFRLLHRLPDRFHSLTGDNKINSGAVQS